MNVTQKDIARRLGISPSLVSRALRGTAAHIGAAPGTVERIRQEAQRLGYHSSAAALTLRGESTQTLGVVVKDFEDPYFGLLLGELQRVAAAAGFSLVLTGRDARQPEQLDAGALWKYQVDGLIIIGSEYQPQGLQEFFAAGMPVVQIGTGSSTAGMGRVCMDQALGLGRLLDYLRALGHRQVGYVSDGSPASLRRKTVLEDQMRRRRLPVQARWFVQAGQPGPDAGAEAAAMLLRGGVDRMPTALVAGDDVLAQSALRALFDQGCRVPQDLSLAGVDDIPSARRMIPALTTLRQPMAAMVQQAFDLVVHGGRAALGRVISVAPELVVRESGAAPRSQPSKAKGERCER
jgi:DNA-binding LacI/PurR family transcriptional regulator